ncbi:MAG: hypothetical protein V4702_00340 [Patescibacteria group bacterium]
MIDYLVHDEAGNILLFWIVFGTAFIGSLALWVNKNRNLSDKHLSSIISAVVASALIAFGVYILIAMIGIMIFGI